MIKVVGNDIWRSAEKLGWFSENDIYEKNGKKLGYFEDNDIYDSVGKKLGYIEGDFIRTMDGRSIRLEDNRRHIVGGTISDLERAAIRLLIGD
ncbi:MAG: hypothetical protein Q7R94_02775 [bacterium]|nr:hypothetical protein [bacterium]